MVDRKRKDSPDAIWAKCNKCGEIIYNGELSRNARICPRCSYYFPLSPMERMALLSDNRGFTKYNSDVVDPKHGDLDLDKAILTGEIRLAGRRLVAVATDLEFQNEHEELRSISRFVSSMMVNAMSSAVNQELPFLLCINSFEQELPAQMASVSTTIGRLNKKKLLFVSLLAQSDTHCGFPGFAYLADIVIAESNVSLDLHTNLKSGKIMSVQGALSLFHNGLVDMIATRREMKQALASIIKFFC